MISRQLQPQPPNPSPDDNILGLPKLKAFEDDKSNVTQKIKVVFHRTENVVGKEKKCWLTALSSFPTMFSKDFSPVHQKLSFPKRQILDFSKLNEFADNNFKLMKKAESF